MEVLQHSDTWIPTAELGSVIPRYRPTFRENGSAYINEHHAFYATCPLINDTIIDVGIPGWQRREDALKLYELAYYVPGDILELGCFQGLSTTIMAQAIADSATSRSITSVDIELPNLFKTWQHVRARGLRRYVHLRWGDARKISRRQISSKRRFALVFVDDWHSYESVLGACRLLPDLLIDGGFCLFHDFNDVRNADHSDPDYGVAQAVQDGLAADAFDFYGIFGCSALYRKKAPSRGV